MISCLDQIVEYFKQSQLYLETLQGFFKVEKDNSSNPHSALNVQPNDYNEGTSSPLDPYKNIRDIENYRKNILKNSDTKSSSTDPYKSPEEIQAVVKGMQDMHAHSPKPISSNNETFVHAPSSTVSVFTKNPTIPPSHVSEKK